MQNIARNFAWVRAQQWLFAALICLWPTNLFLKFAVESSYVRGLLVDYLLPKLYLTDVFIIALLLCWGGELLAAVRKKKTSVLPSPTPTMIIVSIGCWGLLFMVQLFSQRPLTSVWFSLKLLECAVLGWWLIAHRAFLHSRLTAVAVMMMLSIQISVAVGQFVTAHPVFPSYLWLGETRLDQRAGIVYGIFGNREMMLPYGTTAHPNILAGVVATGLLLLCATQFHNPLLKKIRWLLVLSGIGVIVLTQSWSAGLTLMLGYIILWKKAALRRLPTRPLFVIIAVGMLLVPLIVHQGAVLFPKNPSLTRRDLLNTSAVLLWQKYPINGVGLHAFTATLEQVSTSLNQHTEVARFVQPAHHLGLLYLAETGLVGWTILGCWLVCMGRALTSATSRTQRALTPLAMVVILFLPIVCLDHYLLTNQVGQLIMVIGGLGLVEFITGQPTEMGKAAPRSVREKGRVTD